jgi:hypothetical protein
VIEFSSPDGAHGRLHTNIQAHDVIDLWDYHQALLSSTPLSSNYNYYNPREDEPWHQPTVRQTAQDQRTNSSPITNVFPKRACSPPTPRSKHPPHLLLEHQWHHTVSPKADNVFLSVLEITS